MYLKKYKKHIIIIIFNINLLFAVYTTYGLINNIGDSITQQNNLKEKNNILIETELDLTLPLWADSSYKMINLVWCLFLGSLIYGKIEE